MAGKITAAICMALAVLAGLAAATQPIYAAAVIAVLVSGLLAYRLGIWRSLYAATLILTLCATSSQPLLPEIAYYPRYAAAVALACSTFWLHGAKVRKVKDLSRVERTLILGMHFAEITALCSTLWSVAPLITLQQTVALFALFGALHALMTRRWTDTSLIPGDLAIAFWVLTSFFALGIIANFLGVPGTQSPSGYDGVNFVGYRYQGMANNPNMLAVLCVLAAPLGWYLFQQGRRKRYVLGLLPVAASVLMSQSRTALIAILGGGLLMLALRGPAAVAQKLVVAAVATGLLSLSGLMSSIQSSDLATQISNRFASEAGGGVLNGRSGAWNETLALVAEQPGTGYGYAAGPALFKQLQATGSLAFTREVTHNSYLQWLLETGVIGIPALAVLMLACGRSVIISRKNVTAFGLGWCVVAGLLLMSTESAMFGTGQAYPFVFWFAAAAGCVVAGERSHAGASVVTVPEEPLYLKAPAST